MQKVMEIWTEGPAIIRNAVVFGAHIGDFIGILKRDTLKVRMQGLHITHLLVVCHVCDIFT